MAKKFKEIIQFYPNAKKGKPEESEGTLDQQGAMPAVVVREQKNDQMEITHKSGRKETAKVHMTGSDYHIVKNKHGQQFTVNKKGHVLHGHGNVNEESLEESLDPSEVASNPKMYSADTAKKAYYHKKASESDKKSLANHLDRHHGSKEWRKPVKEETEDSISEGRNYHDNRTGFAKREREDDEYHVPDPVGTTHKITHTVSKDGGEKHKRTVTISNSTKSHDEAKAAAKAHLEKQGYRIHEEVELEEGLQQTLRKVVPGYAKRQIDKKMDAEKFGRTDADRDANYWRYKKVQDKLKKEEVEHAPVAPTIPRKYIKGTPEYKAYKATKKPRVGHPTNMKEETELEESMTDSWKKVQSMDKGSLTGGKAEAKKHLAYLHAVHTHHQRYGNDTKKVRDKIESINRSRIAEDVEEGYVNAADYKIGKDGKKHSARLIRVEDTEQGTDMEDNLQSLDERNKENAIKRKMMDASRGARYKVAGNPVPDPEPQHSTARAHNKAIGRALRREEEELSFTQEELQLIEQFIEIAEKMNLSKATMGDVIKDFKKSDAPQFAGKSDEKRRQMAIAAKLQADRETKKEETEITNFSSFVEGLKGSQHKLDKNKNGKLDSQDFKMLRKEETEQVDENAFDWKAKKSEPSSGRYEIKRENGRTIVTRKYNPDTGISTGTDDEPNAPKRGRGRPAGSKNRGSAK